MIKFKYDIAELEKLNGFDALYAVKNLGSHRIYYDKLTEFTQNSKQYLRSYNPTVILHSEEVRNNFFDELESARRILKTIGATAVSNELRYIKKAAQNNTAGTLSNGLLKFYADMEIMARQIISVRSPDEDAPYETLEKPVIFAVDDKSEILSTIRDMLDGYYKVIAVTNGKVALKAMQLHSPSLFLLDIEMPVMNGYELAKQIRAQARFKNTPILFLTGKSTRTAVINAVLHGGNDYILKPVEQDTLLEKIEAHLAKPG